MAFPFSFLPALLLLGLPLAAEADTREPLLFGNPVWLCRNGAFPGGGTYAGPKPTFLLADVIGPRDVPVHFLQIGRAHV